MDTEFCLITLKKLLKIRNSHSNTHNSQNLTIRTGKLAVDKNGNPVLSSCHLIIVYHDGVILVLFQHLIEPFIFRIFWFQNTVQSVKVVIAFGSHRCEKNRIISVFLLVCAQVFPDRLRISLILQMGLLPKQEVPEQTVICHGK